MNSWWELGEYTGHTGKAMETSRLTCAFCGEEGHFALAFHGEKKKPNKSKCLNFDVYQCTNCMGYVHVLWSAGRGWGTGLYSYRVLPWPLEGKPKPSENWPDGMKRFWIQAHDSLNNENWDAANERHGTQRASVRCATQGSKRQQSERTDKRPSV